jgi:uncharacterized protein with PQ loop repeat
MIHEVKQHIHKRERVHSLKQNYPHPDLKIRLIDDLSIVFSILNPMTVLPQIHLLYTTQDGTGLSLSMWIFYCFGCIPFLLYAIVHKVPHLILLNVLWMIVQIIMVVGILIYG